MKHRRLAAIAALLFGLTVLTGPATAQRREGARARGVFKIQLKSPAKFGEVTVPARRYRLTVGNESFALSDVNTMVLRATVPFEATESSETVNPARVELIEQRGKVEIVLRYSDRVLRAVGVTTEPVITPGGPVVTLAGKRETLLERSSPEQASAEALVKRAMKRHLPSLKHCADKAHRSRWRTDDPRFVRCVCPMLEKWRLPRLEKAIRIDHPLSKGRNGFSFTATVKGRTEDCRVWTGTKPPVEAAPEPTPAVGTPPSGSLTPSEAPKEAAPAEPAP